ncbi:hypothetical protein [Streptomyces spiralis]|uniref:hypothetical protein n=1 Tax=Streptomyces spiralis TaxID=66376 RepID=UPI0033ED7999
MEWLVSLVGVGLVMAALRDLFHTLWHPTRHAGLSRLVMTGMWRLAQRLRARRRVVGLVGPLAMVTVVGLWAAIIILGWSIIYWPPDEVLARLHPAIIRRHTSRRMIHDDDIPATVREPLCDAALREGARLVFPDPQYVRLILQLVRDVESGEAPEPGAPSRERDFGTVPAGRPSAVPPAFTRPLSSTPREAVGDAAFSLCLSGPEGHGAPVPTQGSLGPRPRSAQAAQVRIEGLARQEPDAYVEHRDSVRVGLPGLGSAARRPAPRLAGDATSPAGSDTSRPM